MCHYQEMALIMLSLNGMVLLYEEMRIKMINITNETILPVPNDELIARMEKFYRIKLPKSYTDFLKKYNGARPNKRTISFDDETYMVGSFLCLLGDAKTKYEEGVFDIGVIITRIEEFLIEDPDMFGINIVPILALAGESYICLDFRNNFEEPEICIWYFEHSREWQPFTRKLADNFNELLELLEINLYFKTSN